MSRHLEQFAIYLVLRALCLSGCQRPLILPYVCCHFSCANDSAFSCASFQGPSNWVCKASLSKMQRLLLMMPKINLINLPSSRFLLQIDQRSSLKITTAAQMVNDREPSCWNWVEEWVGETTLYARWNYGGCKTILFSQLKQLKLLSISLHFPAIFLYSLSLSFSKDTMALT